jgi:hypothetical protein
VGDAPERFEHEHESVPVSPHDFPEVLPASLADAGSRGELDESRVWVGEVMAPPSPAPDGEVVQHPSTAPAGHPQADLDESASDAALRLTAFGPADESPAKQATAGTAAGDPPTGGLGPIALSGTDESAPVVADPAPEASDAQSPSRRAPTDVADPTADPAGEGGEPDPDLATVEVAAGHGAASEDRGPAAAAVEMDASGVTAVSSPPLDQEPWAGLPPEADSDLEPAPQLQTTPAPGRDRAARTILLTLTAVAVVAAILLAVLVVVRHNREQSGTAAVNSSSSRNAVVAAVNAAPALLSYDYRNTVAKQVATLSPLVTASCQASYTKDLDKLSSTLNPLKVVEKAALLQPDTNAAGVESSTDGRVVVLVFAELTTTNSRLSAPMVEAIQVSLTMEKQGSSWKVNGVVSKGSGGSNQSAC